MKLNKIQELILKVFQQNKGKEFTSEDLLRSLGVNYNTYPTAFSADFSPVFRKENGIQHSGASTTRIYWLPENGASIPSDIKADLKRIQTNQTVFAKFERELDEIKKQMKKSKQLEVPETALTNMKQELIDQNDGWWQVINKDLTQIKEAIAGMRKGMFGALNNIQADLKKWGFGKK